MNNNIILATYTDIDYTLIRLGDNDYTPFCAAWGYNPETETWCQGHYFRTLDDAIDYIRSVKETEKPSWQSYNRMAEIASTAISYMAENGYLEDYLEDRDIDLTEDELGFFEVEPVEEDDDYLYDDNDYDWV